MEWASKLLIETAGYLYPVKLARTQEEKEAVYRFRYKIYVEVMNMRPYHADHARKMFSDIYDNEKNTLIFYMGDLSNITGTITLRIWEKGNIPQEIQQKFDTKLFPSIDDLTISEAAYFMIDPKIRGKLIPLSLIKSAYDYSSAFRPRLDLSFCSCMPGLVVYYEKLGFRVYSNKFIQVLDGLLVPMVTIPFDLSYQRKLSTPFISLAKKYALPDFNQEKYDQIYSVLCPKNENTSVITNPQLIKESIESSELNENTCELLSFLSKRHLTQFCKLILKVPQGMYVLNKGTDNKEIYIILDGNVAILVNECHIKTLGKGDIFGEMALFTKQGRRTADTLTTTPVTLAVLRKNDIKRAMKKDKELAINFLYGISRIVCTKLTDMIETLSESKKNSG